jgi:hypothetical protein
MAAEKYPSYECLQESGRLFGSTVDFCRVRWCLRGTTSTSASVSVVQDPYHPNAPLELEAYQSKTSIHPISELSLTAPPCSSIELSIDILNEYTSNWQYIHKQHATPGERGVRFVRQDLTEPEDEEHPGTLVHCCGEDVPGPGPTLKVQAPLGTFLTIAYFIATVHPWLSSLEDQLRAAVGVHDAMPLDAQFDLFVQPSPLNPMRILSGDVGKLALYWDSVGKKIAKFWPRWEARNLAASDEQAS